MYIKFKNKKNNCFKKGVLGNMINELEFNETPLEYTISGLKI